MNTQNSLLFGCIILLMLACNNNSADKQSSESGYVITGKIKGIHSGTAKLLRYNEDDGTYKTVDSVTFKNDSIQLKGKLDYAQLLILVIDSGNWSMPIFAENTNMKIEGDTTGSEYTDWTTYSYGQTNRIKKFTITGSESNNDYQQYQNNAVFKNYDAQFKTLYHQIDSLHKTNIDAMHKADDKLDSLQKASQNEKLSYVQAYQAKKPSSVVGAYILSQVYATINDKPWAKTDSILNRFQGEAKKSVYYKNVAFNQSKLKAVQPGNTVPDFTLMKRDSSKFSLSSMRGNYTMIDFWASWCTPCRRSIPHWKNTYSKYHSKGFNIVSVSNDDNWAEWFKALDAENMPWQQVCDEYPQRNRQAIVEDLYATTYIPFYVLLDKDGKILVYSGKEEDIDNKLKEIFGS